MRKRVFVCLLAVLAAFAGPGWATDPRYADSRWSGYTNDSIYDNIGLNLYGGTFGNNCLSLAILVVRNENNVFFKGYEKYDNRILATSSDWMYGVGPLSGKYGNDIYIIIGEYHGDGNYITADDVREAFANARVGDVIQMVVSRQHTAVISEKNDDGFEVLQSNWPNGTINNMSFTYEEFAQQCRYGGSAGGFTIYRFGTGAPVIPSDWIKIDAEHFPDEAFRNYLLAHEKNEDGGNGDGYFSPQEIEWITYLDGLDNKGIKSLEGIKNFTNLRELHISSNKGLGTLDLSGMTKLEVLECRDDGLYNLNLSGCTALKSLNCVDNSGLTSLTFDSSTYPAFKTLNVSGCKNLTWLECYGVTVTGVEKPTITTSNLSNGFVGQPYHDTLSATGIGPITYALSINASALGLQCDNDTGEITGTPKSERTITITATVKNAAGKNTKDFTVTINPIPEAPTIITDSLPRGYIGVPYEAKVEAIGASDTFLSKSGTLPNGLTVSKLDGAKNRLLISGTPQEKGKFSIKWKAASVWGTDEKTLDIVIDEAFSIVTDSKLPDATIGEPYSAILEASKGLYRMEWRVAHGTSLPDGLTLSKVSGNYSTKAQITGKPAKDAATYAFSIEVYNAVGLLETKKEFTLTVKSAPVPSNAISIDEEHFPDAVFRAYVSKNFDTDGDGKLSKEEIARATVINVSNMGISSLSGLEHFTSLEELYCANNKLTSLPVSAASTLKRLECANNQLRYLALNRYTSLKRLNCRGQVFPYLYVTDTQDDDEESGGYPYWSESLVSLMSYRSGINDVKAYNSAGSEIPTIVGEEYDVYFASMPAKLTYDYKTGAPVSSDLMDVTLSEVHYSGEHTPTIPVAPDNPDGPTSTKGTIFESGDQFVIVFEDRSIPVSQKDPNLLNGNADVAPNLENPKANDATSEQIDTLESFSNNGNGSNAESVQAGSYAEPLEATSLDITAVYNVVGDKWSGATFCSVSNDMDQTDNRDTSEKTLVARNAVDAAQATLGTGKKIAFAYVLHPMKPKKTGIFTFALPLAPDMVTGHRLIWSVIRSARGTADGAIQVAGASLTADDTTAVFIDTTTGKEITSVPESRAVTVSTYLDEKYDYEPVVLTEADKGGDNAPTSDKSGGGCNTLSGGLALMALCGLVARKK